LRRSLQSNNHHRDDYAMTGATGYLGRKEQVAGWAEQREAQRVVGQAFVGLRKLSPTYR
jgi:hypothetical protein